MNDDRINTLLQVRAFLEGTHAVEFAPHTKAERYDFIRRTLIRLAYHTLSKGEKGSVLSYLVRVSGLFADTGETADQGLATARAAASPCQPAPRLYPQVYGR